MKKQSGFFWPTLYTLAITTPSKNNEFNNKHTVQYTVPITSKQPVSAENAIAHQMMASFLQAAVVALSSQVAEVENHPLAVLGLVAWACLEVEAFFQVEVLRVEVLWVEVLLVPAAAGHL